MLKITLSDYSDKSFLVCSWLVACLTPCFDILKLPYREPRQQQPLNIHSSILYTHIFKNNHMEIMLSKNIPTKSKKIPTICRRNVPSEKQSTTPIGNVRKRTSVNQTRFSKIGSSIEQVIWEHIDQ